MSGYRRVNYYELCRLCTSSEGTKMHIFREEGRRRLLPTKIQICLPLQVCEDDSLPKIICNHCVDKLESFYDFRESCVNAEAMLESYFTSLRYSDDLTREGKVYVKDESPAKKKIAVEGEKNTNTVKMSPVQSGPTTVPVTVDSLTNLVQAAAIQIVGHSDPEVTRVQQYKQCPMQAEDNLAKLKWPLTVNDDCFKMQPASVAQAVIEAAPTEARFNYQTCTNVPTPNTTTLVSMKSEGGTQTEFNNLNHKPLQKQEHNQNGSTSSSEDVETETDGNNIYHIHDAPLVKIIPTATAQDMLVQFGFNKDKDTIFRTDDALQRSSIAQMGEFLRVKTVSIMDGAIEETPPASHPTCVHCCKELNTPELVANHQVSCPDVSADEKGGHFACEICGKPFKRKEHLFQHRKLHTGERPYTCNICAKAFSRKEHLVRHAVSHTGQKTHACDMCPKTFSRKDNLHKHRKTHGIAGPYVCETCGKSFVVKHYYTMHKASHNPPDTPDEPLPYRCDICNKGFSVKQYLTTHKLRHRKTMRSDAGNNEPIEQDPLSTVNAAAILPPNVLHQGTNNTTTQATPLFQVTSSGNNTYLCASSTVATNQLLETYRRLHTT